MKTRPGVVFAAIVWGLWTGANPEAQGLSPAAVDSLYRRASNMDVEGIRALAKRLEGAVSGYPNPSRLLTRIGQLYLRAGEARSARSAFQRAVERGPGLTAAHVGLGRVYLELKDDPKGALPHLEAALKADSTYSWTHTFLARALTQIGGLYLRAELADSARSAFQRAIGHDPKLTSAHVGLGRVYLELKDDPQGALPHLEAAVAADSTHAEAHYVLARVYRKMERLEARHAADRAIRYNPKYASAYLLLAQAHQEEGNRQATVFYYKKYLEQKPQDQEPAYAFALDLMEKGRFKALEEITSLMTDRRALPLLAHALMWRGDYEGAMGAFELYAETLDPVERKRYTDISLVGLPHEIAAYKTTPPEKREAFLRQFWLRHDPFKASGGSMRRAEHYRRVWHARTYYGKVKSPWDRRGEVYIRYGEPDYRSSSLEPNVKVPPAVERVQDEMAYRLYGASGFELSFMGPVYPIRTDLGRYRQYAQGDTMRDGTELELFPGVGVPLDPEFKIGLSGWKPVTVGNNWASVPWEVWVYANVGNGLEITFTDEFLSGSYDYAPVPGLDVDDLEGLDEDTFVGQTGYMRMVQRLTELSPSVRMARVSAEEPERYNITDFEPIDFYYDVVSFRGQNGLTEVQVNISIPIDQVALPGDADTTVLVDRRVALMNSRYTSLLPAQQDLEVPISGPGRGRTLLDRVDLRVMPGDYKLAVQAGRRHTRLLQAYLQDLSLEDYSGDELGLSDLFVARRVAAAEATSDPKFVRRKWSITPLPSHVFETGQHVFVYFEIYNLARDAFGATRYEVTYELHWTDEKGARLSPLLTRVLGRTGAAVRVSYEQTGTEASVSDYVGLDVGETAAGRHVVRMTVKDRNSGQEVSKEGIFWVTE